MPTAQQPRFLLLGTGHWGNPGLDFHAVEFDDMLAPERQSQIADCLDRLAPFAPTHVSIELMPEQAESVNRDYRAWRAGDFALTANERHQLGFRLAARAGLDHIDLVDWHDLARPIPWQAAIDFALANDQAHLVRAFTEGQEATDADRAAETERLRRQSVREQLLQTNDAASIAESHRVYLDLARIGSATSFIGAEVALRWYERNLMIFANLARLANRPDDRILCVIGGGHLATLDHFLRSAGFHLDSVADYLT